MPVYTVHEPPPRKTETSANPDRFSFVRDGFYFWAFVLTPLWMIVHRLWLVLVMYLAANTILMVALHLLGVGSGGKALVGALLSLLVGFEGGTLRRWTLNRRKYIARGVVVGDDQETAEQRFFASWVAPQGAPAEPERAAPPATAYAASRPIKSSDVIGLFPEPGARG